MKVLFKNNITIGVCPSDYTDIRQGFDNTYNALLAFNQANVNIFQSQFLFGMEHAVRPMNISNVNLVVLGRNPVNSIRKAHGLPLTNLPVLIGNCLHINTGSLYMSAISDPELLAPGIPRTTVPAITLVELILASTPTLICHQMILHKNGIYTQNSVPLNLDLKDNNIEAVL